MTSLSSKRFKEFSLRLRDSYEETDAPPSEDELNKGQGNKRGAER